LESNSVQQIGVCRGWGTYKERSCYGGLGYKLSAFMNIEFVGVFSTESGKCLFILGNIDKQYASVI